MGFRSDEWYSLNIRFVLACDVTLSNINARKHIRVNPRITGELNENFNSNLFLPAMKAASLIFYTFDIITLNRYYFKQVKGKMWKIESSVLFALNHSQ